MWNPESWNRFEVCYRVCLAPSSILTPRCSRLGPEWKSHLTSIPESTKWHCCVVVSPRKGDECRTSRTTGITQPTEQWVRTCTQSRPQETWGRPLATWVPLCWVQATVGLSASFGASGIFSVKCHECGLNKSKWKWGGGGTDSTEGMWSWKQGRDSPGIPKVS